jgi:hypothetical protein
VLPAVNEYPSGQYRQVVPLNEFCAWYIPVEHAVQLVDNVV